MGSSFRLNRFEAFALVAVIVTSLLLVGAALDAAHAYNGALPIPAERQVLGCLGWLIATFGPTAISVLFWRWSRTARKAWILHLLMLPLAVLALRIGDALMVFAIGFDTDFDETLGGPILQALLLFILMILGYYSAAFYVAQEAAAVIKTVDDGVGPASPETAPAESLPRAIEPAPLPPPRNAD